MMEIRLLNDGEETETNNFNNKIYQKTRTIEQWRWEFAENNYQKRPIPYAVVDDNGRVAGTQAFIPIRLIDKDGIFWTAKSEETLVDPDYRGQKLFDKMYSLLFDYAKNHQLAFIWGFTPATKAFHKLKFETPCITSQLLFPFSSEAVRLLGKVNQQPTGMRQLAYKIALSGASLVSRLKKSVKSHLPNLRLQILESAPEEAGDVCQRFVQQWGGITIYRDKEYLNWRLYKNPYLRSNVIGAYLDDNLVGWLAFAMDNDRVAYLVDIIVAGEFESATTRQIISSLLLNALNRSNDMGAVAFRGWHVNSHPFDLLVKQTALSLGFYHINQGHHMVLYSTPGIYSKNFNIDDWYVNRIYTEGVLG